MELFKLVTYYNGKNVPFSEWEEWHGMRVFGENEPNTWTPAGLADLLFEVLPHTPETVSIYIAGLIKFATPQSVERAKEIHKEFASNIVLCREAYDALISVSNLKDAKSLLKEMAAKKIKPSASTWDALILAVKQIKSFPERIAAFEAAVGEIKAVGDRPSLRSYQLILSSLAESLPMEESKDSDKKKESVLKVGISWLSEMLADLENRSSLDVVSTKDHLFFLDAMGLAYQAGNLEIAENLIKLYESAANTVKMPALPVEGIFYNRYLLLFIERTSSMEEIEKKYKEFVPRLVGVSRQLTLLVAEKLKVLSQFFFCRNVLFLLNFCLVFFCRNFLFYLFFV
ncbi:unnamed protein product [Nippostrongylus brasiliensis]|uniref:Protein PTCD3 homolog, mitochondrial (inferred by orthology to a D. melanogaster protein) n=1 Tax=Nippostrongylus brasiliensis TaxID=27835 RepID=A0A0N4YL44_NIPBR|nr:unnamed protein product [Nippostrongylus brasiliensis]